MVPVTSSESGEDPEPVVSRHHLQKEGPRTLPTCKFDHESYIKYCDNLSFPLADVDVAFHALDPTDLCHDIPILCGQLGQGVLEPLPRPRRAISVHPMPVVGVMEHHGDWRGVRGVPGQAGAGVWRRPWKTVVSKDLRSDLGRCRRRGGISQR